MRRVRISLEFIKSQITEGNVVDQFRVKEGIKEDWKVVTSDIKKDILYLLFDDGQEEVIEQRILYEKNND